MLQSLINIDHQWLLAINQWHAPWADTFFWTISRSLTWLPLYALLVTLIVVNWRSKLHRIPEFVWILVGFALAVGLSDFITSGVIKPLVMRPRPTHHAILSSQIHLVNGYQGGAYGFVSSHAANTMACALLFSLLYRRKWMTGVLMLWVALNCYSRMYLGVHYPLDILGGLIVGAALSLLIYGLLCRCGIKPREKLPKGGSAERGFEECADVTP